MDVISRGDFDVGTGWVLGDFVVFGWDPVEISF